MRFNHDGLNTTEHRDRRIIVSLTSYPARINIVPYVIASILNQTMKPDKIILWLGIEQFPNEKLPDIFEEVRACGVEVRFCEDIGPHKKYLYAMKEYPEDILITFDDDIFYEKHIIRTLYESYLKHPDCVSAMRVHKITFSSDGSIKPYTQWQSEYKNSKGHESYTYIATNGAGSIFPPHRVHDEIFNIEAMKKLCPKADDIWLKVMEVMNDTKVVHACDESSIPGKQIYGSQEFALWRSNVSGGENDMQIKAVLDAYNTWPQNGKTLIEMMREDSNGVE